MEVRRQSSSKFDMCSALAGSHAAYELLFRIRFDVPFPFYDDEITPKALGDHVQLQTMDTDTDHRPPTESIPASMFLGRADTILSKVGLRRVVEPPEAKKRDQDQNMAMNLEKSDGSPGKSVRRRAAVFDHHDTHPDWAKEDYTQSTPGDARIADAFTVQRIVKGASIDNDSSDPMFRHQPLQHFQSMRLNETRNRGSPPQARTFANGEQALDRSASAYVRRAVGQTQSAGPASPSSKNAGSHGYSVMSEVNQMRTDRLANALKALERRRSRRSPEPFARTQSMRTPRGRHQAALDPRRFNASRIKGQILQSESGAADYTDEERMIDFRRRTSSVPYRYDEMTHLRNPERRILDRPHSPSCPNRSSSKPALTIPSELGPIDDGSAYQRMRTFTVDPARGSVINRGDSFRRRCDTSAVSPPPMRDQQQQLAEASKGRQSPATLGSKNSSNHSSRSHSPLPSALLACLNLAEPASPTLSYGDVVKKYTVVVMGWEGVGKTSVINQFMTSEYCNPFQNDCAAATDNNSVTVILNGEESQLTFVEVDNQKNDLSLTLSGAGYIVVYSIDDGISFDNAKQVLFRLRLQTHSAEKPIILVGNKMDLERKRVITTEEGKAAAKENGCKFVEIAVALGHHIDELLVAILAQVRHNEKHKPAPPESWSPKCKSSDELQIDKRHGRDTHSSGSSSRSSADESPAQQSAHHPFAIRASSIKRVKQIRTGFDSNSTTSCSNLTAAGYKLADRVFGRRRGSRSLEDLLSIKK